MTFENNIMESKKIIAKGMLLSVGVGMMMSHDRVYGTDTTVTESILPDSKIKEKLKDKFIKIYDNVKKNNDYETRNKTGCLCCCKDKAAWEIRKKGEKDYNKLGAEVRKMCKVESTKIDVADTITDPTANYLKGLLVAEGVNLQTIFSDVTVTSIPSKS